MDSTTSYKTGGSIILAGDGVTVALLAWFAAVFVACCLLPSYLPSISIDKYCLPNIPLPKHQEEPPSTIHHEQLTN